MRRRRWTRRVGAVLGTLSLGAILGFLVPTVIAEYTPRQDGQSGQLATPTANTELPVARAFINAFVTNDQAKLRAIGADEVDAVKANDLASQVTEISPPVLLGSIGAAGVSIQAYASSVTLNDGTRTILSWRVLTSSGRATLILPPQALPQAP